MSLGARVRRHFPEAELLVACRGHLRAVQETRGWKTIKAGESRAGRVLIIDANLVVDESFADLIRKKLRDNVTISSQGLPVAAYTTWRSIANIVSGPCPFEPSVLSRALRGSNEKLEHDSAAMIRNLWDIMSLNEYVLGEDLKVAKSNTSRVPTGYVVRGDPSYLSIDESVDLEPGVIFDVRRGGIRLAQGCKVLAPSRIEGPCWISEGTQVFPGSYISKSAIGVECRVGGEVSNSIMDDYSNKRHSGFLGDSYVGRWVNLAADTQTSNLKTTYGTVRMNVNGHRADTGKMFLGSFIGDHVKTGIGTQIFAGRRIGIFSHVIGYVTEDVPSFTFWGKSIGSKPVELELESALETQQRAAARRNVRLADEEMQLTRVLFKMTRMERKTSKVRKGKIDI